MMEVCCAPENRGLLAVLWPGLPVVSDFRFLIPPAGYVYVGEREVCPPPEGMVACVRESRGVRIDTKEGFLSALGGRKGVPKSHKDYLLSLAESDFWESAKLYAVTRRLAPAAGTERFSLFHLFQRLFDGFAVTYPIYRALGRDHRNVVSGLATMMGRCLSPPGDASAVYRFTLTAHKPHLPLFRQRLADYLLSSQEEHDFLSFLFFLDPRGRFCSSRENPA